MLSFAVPLCKCIVVVVAVAVCTLFTGKRPHASRLGGRANQQSDDGCCAPTCVATTLAPSLRVAMLPRRVLDGVLTPLLGRAHRPHLLQELLRHGPHKLVSVEGIQASLCHRGAFFLAGLLLDVQIPFEKEIRASLSIVLKAPFFSYT